MAKKLTLEYKTPRMLRMKPPGHESVKTTLDTYSHLYPDKDQNLADRLNQFRRTPPAEENT